MKVPVRNPRFIIVGALTLGIATLGGWLLTQPSLLTPAQATSASPSLIVEGESTVGEDLTEGEATAWNNAAKIAVDPQGGIHVVYQYAYGKRGEPDRMRYARSLDGRRWSMEEWTGRYPTIAIDKGGRVSLAYVERTPEADRLWLRVRDSGGTEGKWLIDEGPRRTRAYPALVPSEGALFLAWETHESGVHRIRFAEISRQGEIAKETVVEDERGVFFPTPAVVSSGRIYLAWQAAEDARRYRIEVAVRDKGEAGWRLLGRLAGESGDGRFPTLAPLPPDGEDGIMLAFVSLGPNRESTLYRAVIRRERLGEPEAIAEAIVRGPLPAEGAAGQGQATGPLGEKAPPGYRWASRAQTQSYAQELVAFPTLARGLLIWGHTVPDACGTGPLFWAFGTAPRSNELLGAFASYPHLASDPNEDGIFHLVWTDRRVEELRAFEVRYARLRLRSAPR